MKYFTKEWFALCKKQVSTLNFKFFIVFIVVIFITGCSSGVENYGDAIVVQKYIGEDGSAEPHKEINQKEVVQKVKDILNRTSWNNTKVDKVYPPDYKFYFENQSEPENLIYDLWISPENEQIELLIDSENKNVQLDKKKSAELFEILTGDKLSDI